ncbi:MAG TPA: hypothetical protein VM389_12490 [Phycisphaerae bacterium]|nr:hypothetical protein [Phycisphaerae bacterium]HUU23344.1 hypothetical protein [Phycisphaerae bacterium]
MLIDDFEVIAPVIGGVAGLVFGGLMFKRHRDRIQRAAERGRDALAEKGQAEPTRPARPVPIGKMVCFILLGFVVGAVPGICAAVFGDGIDGDPVGWVIIGCLVGVAWSIVSSIAISCALGTDVCPRCEGIIKYYRRDAGLEVTCARCGMKWQAGAGRF